jgi:catechol 2,3-dioxygenase-like lactoylglutathione lyase family enzyme
MLDHIVLNVSDYERSRTFYEQALASLGFSLLVEPRPGAGGFGTEGKPSFWISDQRRPVSENVHVAFTVQDRATVDAFHAAAVQAGGTDNGAPGVREIYHPTYYGAYVLDPDGTTSRRSATRLHDSDPCASGGAHPEAMKMVSAARSTSALLGASEPG